MVNDINPVAVCYNLPSQSGLSFYVKSQTASSLDICYMREGGREGGMDSHIPSLSNPASHALSSHYYAEDDTLFSYSSIYLSIYLSTYHDT